MGLEELFKNIILNSMMDNSKMDYLMDMSERLIKMVTIINMNIKMERK